MSIKLKQVVQVSSEDESFKAENLLKGEKWLGAKSPASNEQFVVLELEQPSEIHQVELQNEASSFIEVQVSNKGNSTSEDDFLTLLAPTSFMSPNESKLGTNTNRTKVFTSDKDLDKDVADTQKWRFVKLICTQPFGNGSQFGIASVKLGSNKAEASSAAKEEAALASKIKPGLFSLKKAEEIEEPDDKPMLKKTVSSKSPEKKKPAPPAKSDSSENDDDNDDDGGAKKAAATPSPKKPNLFERKTSATTSSSNHGKENRGGSKEQLLRGVIFALSGFQNPLRGELRDLGMKLGAKYRPDWTDDCTHLVCAFANTPKAQQVRKVGGKIVTKEWLEDCEHKQKQLNWKDYELKQDDSSDDEDSSSAKPRKAAKAATQNLKKLKQKSEFDESDDEEEEERESDRDFVVSDSEIEYEEDEDEEESDDFSESSSSDESDSDSDKIKKKRKNKKESKKSSKKKTKKASPKKKTKDSDDDESDDEKTKKKKKPAAKKKSESEEEDDLEAYKRQKEKELKQKKKEEPESEDEPATTKKPNLFEKKDGGDTQENSDMEESKEKENKKEESWELPTFFDNKQFYLYGDFDEKRRKQLRRVIIGFGGDLKDYVSDEIDFVITDRKWNKEFEKSLKENPQLTFVTSNWIDACLKKNKMLSHEPYQVSKTS